MAGVSRTAGAKPPLLAHSALGRDAARSGAGSAGGCTVQGPQLVPRCASRVLRRRPREGSALATGQTGNSARRRGQRGASLRRPKLAPARPARAAELLIAQHVQEEGLETAVGTGRRSSCLSLYTLLFAGAAAFSSPEQLLFAGAAAWRSVCRHARRVVGLSHTARLGAAKPCSGCATWAAQACAEIHRCSMGETHRLRCLRVRRRSGARPLIAMR